MLDFGLTALPTLFKLIALYLSRLMRKRELGTVRFVILPTACTATLKSQKCGTLSKASSRYLYCVREQRRLWRACVVAWAFTVRICDKYHFLISKLIYSLLYRNKQFNDDQRKRDCCLLSTTHFLTINRNILCYNILIWNWIRKDSRNMLFMYVSIRS